MEHPAGATAAGRVPVCVLGVTAAADAPNISGLRGHDDEIEVSANVVRWRTAGACLLLTSLLV